MNVLGYPHTMFVNACGAWAINIPPFLGPPVGFADRDSVFIGLEANPDQGNVACRVWISPFEMTGCIGQLSCAVQDRACIQKLGDVVLGMNLNILHLKTSSLECEDSQHVSLIFRWPSASIQPLERNHYVLLSDQISHLYSDDMGRPFSDGINSISLLVRPFSTPLIPGNRARTSVARRPHVVDRGEPTIATTEGWDVVLPSDIDLDLRRRLGADACSALEYMLTAETGIPLLRAEFPVARRWTGKGINVEATSTLIRFSVVHDDIPGQIGAVIKKLKDRFDVVSSNLRRDAKDGPSTARLEMIVRSGHSVRDALQQQAVLHSVFSLMHVRSVLINRERLDSNASRIFVAYDFGRVDLAALISNKLRDAVVVIGRCEDDSTDWRRFVREQIANCDGLLGVIPNRDEGPSKNLFWEFEEAQVSGIPSQWLVSDQIPDDSRARGGNVTVFAEDDPEPALTRSLEQLFSAINRNRGEARALESAGSVSGLEARPEISRTG